HSRPPPPRPPAPPPAATGRAKGARTGPGVAGPGRQRGGAARPAGLPATRRPGLAHPQRGASMTRPQGYLYDLLPAVYRLRDELQGGPLRELLAVVAEQVNVLEDDIARLYDNWFIETCDNWVVPYLGDLVGYRQVAAGGEPADVAGKSGPPRTNVLF